MNKLERYIPEESDTLNGYLRALVWFGKPRLHWVGGGVWWCIVDMNTNIKGTSFEVRGESIDPEYAARECYKKIQNVISNLNKSVGAVES